MWEDLLSQCIGTASHLGVICLWLGALALYIIGIAGCILPYPGHVFVLAGCIPAAFALGEPYPAWWVWLLLAVLAIIGMVVDNFTTALGAKRFGSSKRAIWCSLLGLLIGGVFFFPLGLVIGPFVGAFLAELTVRGKGAMDATRSGVGATLGVMGGFIAKLIIAALMLLCFFLLR